MWNTQILFSFILKSLLNRKNALEKNPSINNTYNIKHKSDELAKSSKAEVQAFSF